MASKKRRRVAAAQAPTAIVHDKKLRHDATPKAIVHDKKSRRDATPNAIVRNKKLRYHAGGAITQAPLLTPQACATIRGLADADAAAGGGWGSGDDYAYATRDLEVDKAPRLKAYLAEIGFVDALRRRVLRAHGATIGAFEDAFVVKYEATSQRALTDHVDAGDVSVMVALSDPSSYEGGGTTFGGLPRVVHCGAGDALTFDAALTHRGEPIVAGERYLLVCFCRVGAAPGIGDLDLAFDLVEAPAAPEPVARAWTGALGETTLLLDDATKLPARRRFWLPRGGDARCAVERLVSDVLDFHAASAAFPEGRGGAVFWCERDGDTAEKRTDPTPACATATFLSSDGPALGVVGDAQTFVVFARAGAHVAWPGNLAAGVLDDDQKKAGLRLHVDVYASRRPRCDALPAALAAALSPLRVPFDAGDPDRTSSLYVAGPDEPAGARRHLDAQRARGGPGASIVVGVDLVS